MVANDAENIALIVTAAIAITLYEHRRQVLSATLFCCEEPPDEDLDVGAIQAGPSRVP